MIVNTQNNFENKTIERMRWQYLRKDIIKKEFTSHVKKLEEVIHFTHEGGGSRAIIEPIYPASPLVIYEIKTSYYLEKHPIKMLLYDAHAFASKILLSFKIEETKLRTSNLILKKKIKQCIIELSIVNILLFFSFGNWL